MPIEEQQQPLYEGLHNRIFLRRRNNNRQILRFEHVCIVIFRDGIIGNIVEVAEAEMLDRLQLIQANEVHPNDIPAV